MASILATVDIPAFDRVTGQLALESHHLVSATASYATSFPPDATLVFDPAPRVPYDCHSHPAKRRKLGRESTSESDRHHHSLVLHLEHAIDAVHTHSRSLDSPDSRIRIVDRDRRCSELDLVAHLAERTASSSSSSEPAAAPYVVEWTPDTIDDDLVGAPRVNWSDDDHRVVRVVGAPGAFRIVVPPASGFFLSTFGPEWSAPTSPIHHVAATRGGWDILILDPPWPNASANRSASYETFDPYRLWELDVPALLGTAKPVLVAVWVTNRVKYRRLLLDKLFPKWGVRDAVEWYWVKVASESGEPVWSLESRHRRCYEGLVLGWYTPTKTTTTTDRRPRVPPPPPPPPPLPDQKVFLSTPIGHSRKPVLLDLLIPFLPASDAPPNVVELFARTTLAGPLQQQRGRRDSTTTTSGSSNGPAADDDEDGAKRKRKEEDEEKKKKTRGFFLAVGNEAVKFNVAVDPARSKEFQGWIELDDPATTTTTEEDKEDVDDDDDGGGQGGCG
ncbi:hypothetical protein JCM11491_005528 [Sporobolomyces phaffii]